MISPQDIYTFYYLELAKTRARFNNRLYSHWINRLSDEYISTFRTVLLDQLWKYISRNRVDPDLKHFKSREDLNRIPFNEIKDLMSKTYRSDLFTRNDRWNELATHWLNLSMVPDDDFSTQQRVHLIDRINNTVHNTGEVMLAKLRNGRELSAAFDRAHKTRHPEEFKDLTDQELIRNIIGESVSFKTFFKIFEKYSPRIA